MSGIRGRNTRPEMQVRKGLHAAGFRYRLHDRTLPGKPDIVLPKYRAVIFVHGCFWHGHGCHLFRLPSTRTGFWKEKITGNAERDRETVRKLMEAGWRVGTVWECALKGRCKLQPDVIEKALINWLHDESPQLEVTGSCSD